MTKKTTKNGETDKTLKELKQIKNLMILWLLRTGATSRQVDYATGMGEGNIRAMFPVKRGRNKAKGSPEESRPAIS